MTRTSSTERALDWLDLGARDDRVSASEARRQLVTVETIRGRFTAGAPGLLLADEVGMGKTYVALAVLLDRLLAHPGARALVLLPNRNLSEKWQRDLRQLWTDNVRPERRSWADALLRPERDFQAAESADGLGAFARARVVFAPIQALLEPRGWRRTREDAFFFEAYARWHARWGQRLWGRTRDRAAEALGVDATVRRRFGREGFMGVGPDEVPGHVLEPLHAAFRDWHAPRPSAFRKAVPECRVRLLRERLGTTDLLVIDEAHNYRNEGSARFEALRRVFSRAFGRLLFLTATPFQLGPAELESILKLFALAAHVDDAAQEEARRSLMSAVGDFQRETDRFAAAWRRLGPVDATAVAAALRGTDGAGLSPQASDAGSRFEALRAAKAALEEKLGAVMVRSAKPHYRRDVAGALEPGLSAEVAARRGVAIRAGGRLPFTFLLRLVREVFRVRTTFSAMALQSLTSSFEALEASELMRDEPPGDGAADRNFYRRAIRATLPPPPAAEEAAGVLRAARHPKVAELMANVLAAYEHGQQKTLVFCGRLSTARALKGVLEAGFRRARQDRLRRALGGCSAEEADAVEARLRKYLSDRRNRLWPVLRENHLRGLLSTVAVDESAAQTARDPAALARRVVPAYRRHVAESGLAASTARKLDYGTLQRLCERAAFRRLRDEGGFALDGPRQALAFARSLAGEALRAAVDVDRRPGAEDAPDGDGDGDVRYETIEDAIERLATRRCVWTGHGFLDGPAPRRPLLNDIEPRQRRGLVEAVALSLLQSELVVEAIERQAATRAPMDEVLLDLLTWDRPGVDDHCEKLGRFLRRFVRLAPENREQRMQLLSHTGLVATASGDDAFDRRERRAQAFNTPFAPYVLVATGVAQEGIDLQEECRRVVHYDLSWNPSVLEQRVGRVDRLGSLVHRLRQKAREEGVREDALPAVEVFRPYIVGSIDERIHDVVSGRERWFGFILGGRDQWDRMADPTARDERFAVPLPAELAEELRIRLEPPEGGSVGAAPATAGAGCGSSAPHAATRGRSEEDSYR